MDHGIEPPQLRHKSGKSSEGTITLSASHCGGRVVIEVSDDGAGIDHNKVRSIGVWKGLLPADAEVPESEIGNLLFLPGFSTANAVSSLSGRGVGMGIVQSSAAAMGGRLSIKRAKRTGMISIANGRTLACRSALHA